MFKNDKVYGYHVEFTKYRKGARLLGLNFNTNDDWFESERESYLCIYLWNAVLTIGKFHKYN